MQSGSTLEKLPIGKDSDRAALDRARKTLGTIILGKDGQIGLALSCLLARGHLLIEDLPGLAFFFRCPDVFRATSECATKACMYRTKPLAVIGQCAVAA